MTSSFCCCRPGRTAHRPQNHKRNLNRCERFYFPVPFHLSTHNPTHGTRNEHFANTVWELGRCGLRQDAKERSTLLPFVVIRPARIEYGSAAPQSRPEQQHYKRQSGLVKRLFHVSDEKESCRANTLIVAEPFPKPTSLAFVIIRNGSSIRRRSARGLNPDQQHRDLPSRQAGQPCGAVVLKGLHVRGRYTNTAFSLAGGGMKVSGPEGPRLLRVAVDVGGHGRDGRGVIPCAACPGLRPSGIVPGA